jgi:hypothetical protein
MCPAIFPSSHAQIVERVLNRPSTGWTCVADFRYMITYNLSSHPKPAGHTLIVLLRNRVESVNLYGTEPNVFL